jgi:hypothetical protein
MYNILPKKRDILPDKPINAEKIIRDMVKSNHLHEADVMLRNKFILRQKINNDVYQRDRLRGYIDDNIIPPLKYKLEKEIKRYNDKIDSKLFKLYILGKTSENLL